MGSPPACFGSTSPARRCYDALPRLREVYTGSIAYEIEHISDHAERVWLRKAIETGRYREPLARERPRRAALALSRDGGLRAVPPPVVPRAEAVLAGRPRHADPDARRGDRGAAAAGAHEVVIGMAHRGRLNALVHTVGKSYESSCASSRASVRSTRSSSIRRAEAAMSSTTCLRRGTRVTQVGRDRGLRSRRTRAISRRSTLSSRGTRVPSRPTARRVPGSTTPRLRVPILVHGDASFAGQGIVAETFNLQSLDGYCHRRDAAHHHQQPGRLLDRSRREPVDPILERPREGLRRADRPRQRR